MEDRGGGGHSPDALPRRSDLRRPGPAPGEEVVAGLSPPCRTTRTHPRRRLPSLGGRYLQLFLACFETHLAVHDSRYMGQGGDSRVQLLQHQSRSLRHRVGKTAYCWPVSSLCSTLGISRITPHRRRYPVCLLASILGARPSLLFPFHGSRVCVGEPPPITRVWSCGALGCGLVEVAWS